LDTVASKRRKGRAALTQKKGQLVMMNNTCLPEMPSPEPNGFVKTLNQMGYMTSSIDPYSQEFVTFAAQNCGPKVGKPALDIGAAYGVATLEALRAGAQVIANDIEPKHLEILKSRASNLNQTNLILKPGAFPNGLELPEESIGALLICRVLHFFNGPQIENAAAQIFKWLTPGGKVFVVAETPYLKNFQTFIPTYEARKKDRHPWPGFIDNVQAIAPDRGVALPPTIHFLDPEILTRVFTQAGFVVEKSEVFARPDFPLDLQLDGRESVGLIARKKTEAELNGSQEVSRGTQPV
jgi:SAM-dependent methyltransferase